MGDLSEHFSTAEFRCKGTGRPGHRDHQVVVDLELVGRLELLRHLCGDRPLVIESGHRCLWWNRQVGGAGSSQHMVGRAADIRPGYATPAEAAAVGFKGIGRKDGWALHVDTRSRRANWSY